MDAIPIGLLILLLVAVWFHGYCQGRFDSYTHCEKIIKSEFK